MKITRTRTTQLFLLSFISVYLGVAFVMTYKPQVLSEFSKYFDSQYKSQNSAALSYQSTLPELSRLEWENEIVTFVNKARNDAGLHRLDRSSELDTVAMYTWEDMTTRNYWSILSPSGEEPWRFLDKAKYEYISASQNLARDYKTPEEVVASWITNETNKASLLNKQATEIGLHVEEGVLNGYKSRLIVQYVALPESKRMASSKPVVNTNDTKKNTPKMSPISIPSLLPVPTTNTSTYATLRPSFTCYVSYPCTGANYTYTVYSQTECDSYKQSALSVCNSFKTSAPQVIQATSVPIPTVDMALCGQIRVEWQQYNEYFQANEYNNYSSSFEAVKALMSQKAKYEDVYRKSGCGSTL